MNTLLIESDGDDLFVKFTDDLLEELGWSVGDDLDWEVQPDGSITLTKYDETTPPDRPPGSPTSEQERLASFGWPIHDC